jgi:hypothetical protein
MIKFKLKISPEALADLSKKADFESAKEKMRSFVESIETSAINSVTLSFKITKRGGECSISYRYNTEHPSDKDILDNLSDLIKSGLKKIMEETYFYSSYYDSAEYQEEQILQKKLIEQISNPRGVEVTKDILDNAKRLGTKSKRIMISFFTPGAESTGLASNKA